MGCNITPASIAANESCQTNGGMAKKFYYALEADVATMPAPDPAATTFDAAATITDDFVMVATKTFHAIDADLQSVSLEVNSGGEMNNLSSVANHKFRVSGKTKTVAGWVNSYRNKDLIIAAPDNDGNIRILGNKLLPAKILSFQEVSGEKVEDNKLFEITIQSVGNVPYYFEGPAGIPLV